MAKTCSDRSCLGDERDLVLFTSKTLFGEQKHRDAPSAHHVQAGAASCSRFSPGGVEASESILVQLSLLRSHFALYSFVDPIVMRFFSLDNI